MMKALRHIVVLLLVVLSATGCGISKIKDLSVSSLGVKYIVPTSSRSLDAVLLLGLDNPSVTFTVNDVTGDIRYYDRTLAHFTAGELPVQGKSVQVYELPCTVTLDDGISLLDLLVIASKKSLDGMTANVHLRAKLKNGIGSPLNFNAIDLSQFTQ